MQVTAASTGLVNRYTYSSSDTAAETTPGSVKDYLLAQSVAEGISGSATQVQSYTYYKRTANGQTVYHTAEQKEYPTAGGDAVTTGYDPPTWSGGVQIKQETLNLPAVDVNQNGNNVAAQTSKWYDSKDNLIWTMDQRGRVNYYHYNPVTNQIDISVEDVDADRGFYAPTGWTLPTDGLCLQTNYGSSE